MLSILVNELDIRGGTHKQVLRLAQHLKNTGYEYEVLTKVYDPKKTFPEFQNLNVRPVAARFQKGGRLRRMVGDWLLQIKLHKMISPQSKVINIHDNGFPLLMLLQRLSGRKIIWQVNDLPWVFFLGNAKDISASKLHHVFSAFSRYIYLNWVATSVSQVTVNVTKNKERLRKALGLDSMVLYCGVDVWCGRDIKRLGLSMEIKLLSSGVFSPYRNYESQVNAIAKLRDSGYDVSLDIIGSIEIDKKYVKKISDMIIDKELQDKIKIWGQVDELIYQQLHEKSDIFIFVNIDQSWGLSVFEAMSAGLPVIVSKNVGASEVLCDRKNSILVDPLSVNEICEAITMLLDKGVYQSLSENGRKFAQSMSWDQSYSKNVVRIAKELES